MMFSDRTSRITAFNSSDIGYRSDFSSKTNLRKIGRMYTSPSLDRVSSIRDRPVLSRQKSIYDLSNINEMMSSVGISSPISHRNPSFQKLRTNVWRHSENVKSFDNVSNFRSKYALNGRDSYTGGPSATYTSIQSRYKDPVSVLDRRDLFYTTSSPIVNRRVKSNLKNRSNVSAYKHWPISTTSSTDNWRARVRERPLLSNLSTSILAKRSKSPLLNSGRNSRHSSTSSAKLDETVSPERRDSSSGIYRNRYIIKFREHNLGQTASQRRASITWDLPKDLTTGVKVLNESPISEHSEQTQDLKSKDAESLDSCFEVRHRESVFEEVNNKSDDSGINQKELKNEKKIETIEELIQNETIIEKSVSNDLKLKCKGSKLVIDIIPIQTVSVMPEPSGTPIPPLQQKAASLKSKTSEEKIDKIVDKTKSPKKKKIKKKDLSKDKSKPELKLQENEQKVCVESEKVLPKLENKVRKDLNENILNEVNLNQHIVQDLTPKRIKFRKYSFDDFNLLKVLGRGSFGKVFLADLKGHCVQFAIKCLKKHSVIEDDDIESIMIERKVLAYGSAHPFICKLFCTFQTESYLCFAMEWCCGGDLMFHVHKSGRFEEDKARFYATEILCAIEFMHNKGIVYRDLKLDNIMIDNKGHLRLVDFGMCQGRIYRDDLLPSNFCGTPEYMAPEIIKGVKYNQSVDFWSFGVLLYEMVVGTSPFHGTDEEELLWNVCNEEVNYPRYLSETIKSLLVLLLNKCPEQRLGMPTCAAGTIRSQPFFQCIEWAKVEKCQIKPPFVPELSSSSDVCYFEKYFTQEKPNLTPVSEEITLSMDQTVFKGFSYTNHNMTD